MAKLLFLSLLLLSQTLGSVKALLTFDSVRMLAEITTQCFENMTRKDTFDTPDLIQFRFKDGGNGIESLVATSLLHVDKELSQMLNVSMDSLAAGSLNIQPTCSTVIQDYHSFLASTIRLLQAVDEKQQMNRWSRESQVFPSLSWMQALWASRKTNTQDLSFIEQQLRLYVSTSCFGKNEVLRRGVEVVEYINDILDSFL